MPITKNLISRRTALASILALVILSQTACQQNFALDLRLALAAAPPLVASLPISQALKDGDVADFLDLGSGALTMSDALKACHDNPCKLNAVAAYETTFESVLNRGHLTKSGPKVEVILGILRGIIASARIYFGGASPNARMVGKPVTEKEIRSQIDALKSAMKP